MLKYGKQPTYFQVVYQKIQSTHVRESQSMQAKEMLAITEPWWREQMFTELFCGLFSMFENVHDGKLETVLSFMEKSSILSLPELQNDLSFSDTSLTSQ